MKYKNNSLCSFYLINLFDYHNLPPIKFRWIQYLLKEIIGLSLSLIVFKY